MQKREFSANITNVAKVSKEKVTGAIQTPLQVVTSIWSYRETYLVSCRIGTRGNISNFSISINVEKFRGMAYMSCALRFTWDNWVSKSILLLSVSVIYHPGWKKKKKSIRASTQLVPVGFCRVLALCINLPMNPTLTQLSSLCHHHQHSLQLSLVFSLIAEWHSSHSSPDHAADFKSPGRVEAYSSHSPARIMQIGTTPLSHLEKCKEEWPAAG